MSAFTEQTDNMSPTYAALGSDPIGSTPEQFTEFIRKEYLKWAEVIKRAGPMQ